MTMQTITVTPANLDTALQTACAVLSAGGLIVYPTETVYGMGVDATNSAAVSKLLEVKNRPAGKAISVLVADQDAAKQYVTLNRTAKELYARFLPGPLTVVSAGKDKLDPRVPAENGRLGIRISSHPLAHELARIYKKPITATSANPAGGARPYAVEALLAKFSESQRSKIDLVLDYGELPRTEPSTVIDTEESVQQVVRSGAAHTSPRRKLSGEAATHAFGREVFATYAHVVPEKPLIFALHGEMGAGKTHLTQGIAEAMGVEQHVSSPSFTLVKEYLGAQGTLLHADCWRTPGVRLHELGLSEYLHPRNVLVIEWPEPVLDELHHLPDVVLVELMLEFTAKDDERLVHFL